MTLPIIILNPSLEEVNINWLNKPIPQNRYIFYIENDQLIIKDHFGNETILGSGGGTCIRKTEYVNPIIYIGTAENGSLETDAVWKITKIIVSVNGSVISTTIFLNVKWTERGLL